MSTQGPDTISLPKGGGALHGIGETFSPDLHTGTGNFTIPITVPSGRHGFQPDLKLVYSTGHGNGFFGMGWSLSVPGITRKTSKGIPRYRDDHVDAKRGDVFILSGAEDLVPMDTQEVRTDAGLTLRTRYRPRTEGLFAKIHRHRSINKEGTVQSDYWEVKAKDGLTSVHGGPLQNGGITSTLTDPARPSHIFAWKLSETRDPFGNLIRYDYGSDEGSDVSHTWKQPLLSHIRYVDNEEHGKTTFLISITFEYEERADPFSDYRAGFEIRTTQRCRTISIRTHAEQEHLVRTYQLAYVQDPYNGVSLLKAITVLGEDESHNLVQELPPLEFGYTTFEPQRRKFIPLSGAEMPPASLSNPEYELVDLFGNGLPDLLQMNGMVRYWKNLGAGRFDRPREMAMAPAGARLGAPDTQLLDANGDGRMDLMITSGSVAGYYPLQFGATWDPRSFQRYRVAPSFNLKDAEVRLIDLDGDGVTDALRSGTSLECFFNDPLEGWAKTRRVPRQALQKFPNISFADPRVKWADMNGDGLQDIVLVHAGSIEYWPNRGYGDWGDRIVMALGQRLPFDYDPKRLLLGDVDGDGCADLVYVEDHQVILWMNRGGNGWSSPITIKGTPSVTDMDAVRLADMLGNGISGVLWSTEPGTWRRESMFFLDFTGGRKPYLLNTMNNNMGAVTTIDYASSTTFYVRDQADRTRQGDTPLPFPVQVVARVESIDALSKGTLTTEYRYHHGYWDGAEREFRGFGLVEQLDSEEFESSHAHGRQGSEPTVEPLADRQKFSPPALTKTWFHQGPIGEEFGAWQEADYRHEYWEGDPSMLSVSQTTLDTLHALPHRVQRDAIRTWRGSILRTELYVLDDSPHQHRPYTVTESVFDLWEEDSPDSAEEPVRAHIFFPHLAATRSTQWERGDDPMTQFSFTDDYDGFGQPRRQSTVALPRRQAKRQEPEGTIAANETRILATHTRTDYAKPMANTNIYIHDRVAQTRTFELRDAPGVSESEPQNVATVLQEQADAARAVHHQFSEVLKDWVSGQAISKQVHVIGHTINHYDGEAFEGLPSGAVGPYGAITRVESFVLTDAELNQAYEGQRPSYLGGPSSLPPDAPAGFEATLGYTRTENTADGHHAGYYVDSQRRRYDFHDPQLGRTTGFMVGSQDALRHPSTIRPDPYGLLPVEVADPVGLTTRAEYDYKVLQAKTVTDPNGNVSTFTFTPTGLLARTRVTGKAANEGDQTRASVQMTYDFLAFIKSPPDQRQPIAVRTLRYLHHDSETDVALPERDQPIETVEYSDGFGRLLQTRIQGEEVRFGHAVFGGEVLPKDQDDDPHTRQDIVGVTNGDLANPNVVISGWQTYDNKGRVIEKYEPFFSSGWEYVRSTEGQRGQKASMFYDPRGQLLKTVNPDGSEQRVIVGMPLDLSDPERFIPTPWETYTYDTNDNAGRTHGGDPSAKAYEHHWNTPASSLVDALGRTVLTVQRNRAKPKNPTNPLPPIEEYRTRSTYDIQGNVLTIIDPLGRQAFTYVYDRAKHALRTNSIDAGRRITVFDTLGSPVEQRDGKGAITLYGYDHAHRPTRLWACDGTNQRFTLRENRIYGGTPEAEAAGLTNDQAKKANLLGKLYQHYDEAGLLTHDRYDCKGSLLEKKRQVIKDSAILSVFNAPPADWRINAFRVDWSTADSDAMLDPHGYETSFTYDALNRVKSMAYPRDAEGTRKVLRPHFNRGGALDRVELDTTAYVKHIAYNAKGQRVLIDYGNGVITRSAYDAQTFRLVRLRSERYTATGEVQYRPTGTALQDFGYEYDFAGNILTIHDRIPEGGIPNTTLGTNALDKLFAYDPLYRLLSATGRECDLPLPTDPWDDAPKCHDVSQTRPYMQQYLYDHAGSMTRLRHVAGVGSFTREFALADGTNRVKRVTVGVTSSPYGYDDCGNMTEETTARHFEWDHRDRLRVFSTQNGTSEPSIHAQYLYDAEGQRVMKLVRKQGGHHEVTTYIDGIFEHHRWAQMSTALKHNNHLHIMDDQHRIALVRVGDTYPADAGPGIQFHFGDHLGSSNMVIDETGDWMNREELFPYGETSFGSFSKKRYHLTGKERDGESGLHYYGSRYYASWITRWTSCDPTGITDGHNLYQYCRLNPIKYVDPSGLYSEIGHYYTVYFVSLAAGFPQDIAAKNAFFAQMPDQVNRLDAIEVQKDRMFAGTGPKIAADMWKNERTEIHQGLHSLTGGSAIEERAFRTSQVLQSKPGTIDFGFALHAFGDSYAHTEMDGSGKLYETGWGHFWDWTRPDEISARPELYKQYVQDLYLMLSYASTGSGFKPRATLEQVLSETAAIPHFKSEDIQKLILRGASQRLFNKDIGAGYSPESEGMQSPNQFRCTHLNELQGINVDKIMGAAKQTNLGRKQQSESRRERNTIQIAPLR